MKVIRPERSVRISGYAIIFLLVVLPVACAFWAADACEPGAEIYLYSMCFGLALMGCILVHIGFWEKCFSRLELSGEEIRWKCPLRRNRIMSVENCVEIGAYLENVTVNDPVIPYAANVTAEYVTSAADVKPLLTKQVSSSVRWQQTIEMMIADGVDRFVEIGPGKTLSGFVKKINRNVTILNIEKLEDLEKLK